MEFSPSLLNNDTIQPHYQALIGLPIKQGGMGIPPPSSTAHHVCATSCLCTNHATAAVQLGYGTSGRRASR